MDTEETDIEDTKYRIFTKFDVNIKENLTFEGGARYGNKFEKNSDDILVEKKETNFAVGLTYKITENAKISGIYGPLTVLNDYSSDIFEYNTDGIYGDDEDQNTGSIKISVKF